MSEYITQMPFSGSAAGPSAMGTPDPDEPTAEERQKLVRNLVLGTLLFGASMGVVALYEHWKEKMERQERDQRREEILFERRQRKRVAAGPYR